MTTTSREWTAQVLGHTRRLAEYKETVSRLFPSLPRYLVDARSIRDVDALVLALFLRCYPRELSVLEVGTSFGVSTFHFASQPSVSMVIGVDPDLSGGREAGESIGNLHNEGEPEAPQGPRAIDVARAALAEFAVESAKVRLLTGDVSSAWTSHRGDPSQGLGETPAQELPEDQTLLAFVNGARTRSAGEANLQTIFDANPRAIAILDRCRGIGGPFVQAGIAAFLERAKGEHHFRLFSDLSSGMATSNLGIVYRDADSAEVQGCLADLGQLFSERLDPLWLANREQELIGVVNKYRDEAASLSGQLQDLTGEHQLLVDRNKELEKRASRLEKRKAQLEERTSDLKKEKEGLKSRTSQLEKRKVQLEERTSRLEKERSLLESQLGDFRTAGRYKLADAVTKNVLRLPGAEALARRVRPGE
jgi:hypothetical protein